VKNEPYFKIAEYEEVRARLVYTGDPETAFRDTLSALATGWSVSEGTVVGTPLHRWAVWNPLPSAIFVEPCVRWALVELLASA